MRNYFTITVSDVHGTRDYSFRQFMRKFTWFLIVLFLVLWAVGGLSIWWLSSQANYIEKKHQLAIQDLNNILMVTRSDYDSLLFEKDEIEQELVIKTGEITFLDQTLQGLEELVGENGFGSEGATFDERVQQVQLSSLGKDLMLAMVPSGPAITEYRGLTSKFGRRKHPITGKEHKHGGIDYRAKTGVDVIATADGMVRYSAYNKGSGFGHLITLSHSNGIKTRYAHLSKRSVKVGTYVQKGDKIGEVGNTGRSSGSHLHYEVWFLYHKLNPKPFNDWSSENYNDIFTKIKGVPWGSLTQAVSDRVKKVEKQLLLRDVSLVAKSLN